jgi:N-acetylmuramate 1-kinase
MRGRFDLRLQRSSTVSHPESSSTQPDVVWTDASRRQHFADWLAGLSPRFGIRSDTLTLASADASFRRYLRVQAAQGSLIIMDAPPPLEDVRPFVHVAGLLQAAGVHVPTIWAQDLEQGFLLLTDLGSRPYLGALKTADGAQADLWMREATQALVTLQSRADAAGLPPFDRALLQRELDLFPQWCVAREFGIQWSEAEQAQWARLCGLLIDSALAQPTVFVHRDWMPRNWMLSTPNPAILDFQDAVRGPITYDIASQLRDAFISWDEDRELDWAVRWWQQARAAGLPVDADFGECWRQIEWMGMQRHLKVAGIFCRLKHRDGKPHYASDLPRFFNYLTKVATRYRPLQPLLPLLAPLSGRAVESGFTF